MIPMVHKICLFQWNRLLQENKKTLWLSFSFFHCPSETLLSVTLSTAFRWSLSGESLGKDDYLLGGTKGNTFLLSDLALTFLAKILITLNC